MREQSKLGDMLGALLRVDDETWGRYALSRDILNQRIQPEQKAEMIAGAVSCGRQYARRISEQYGCRDVRLLAERLKLRIEFQEVSMTGKRILFACYTPPDKIIMMAEPVRKAARLVSGEAAGLVDLFRQDDIMNTILGHEIFHVVEDRFEPEIYTRTEKIILWNLLGLKHRSTIRALSEIGAMAFTRELNKLNYSPFILDFLLYFSYDSSGAEEIYRDVLGVGSGRCRETVEDYK
ncbi:hypothetical protein [Paenibacillus macerans]|uniref:hypothetical protein n=1 Tax=Paenibacillus macerans TaxID=44252 RepID=UPI00203E234D|nr:hypothetical protein [Paenibacillus macerans]MCM3699487.1 hypothetical protein [Paenibacillus macerans]